MALLERQLTVKTSTIPGAGNGLFTTEPIPRGTRIVEYKGKRSTWNDANHADGKNPYIFFINRNNVIDALKFPKALARFANDAKGIGKIKGINNNCEYVIEGKKVFIESIKDIPAGEEILVAYGKDYWDTIRELIKDSKQDK
jgi:SET domain-containing protein